jgi:hypothetical protein
MPKLEDFSRYIGNYASETLFNASEVVTEVADLGAEFMRESIATGSPTGTEWHEYKNQVNNYEPGARIGSRVAFDRFGIDKNSGLMLRSVSHKYAISSKNKIVSKFGWINTKKDYFAQQDTGSYMSGGVGMGLLNEGENALRKYGAVVYTQEQLIKIMRRDGFKVTQDRKGGL